MYDISCRVPQDRKSSRTRYLTYLSPDLSPAINTINTFSCWHRPDILTFISVSLVAALKTLSQFVYVSPNDLCWFFLLSLSELPNQRAIWTSSEVPTHPYP